MGGKHLKKLRAEKAKVQLKKKKLLPKGQNITDTSFRAKKIILVEQLKKVDENEPVSSWNLTLKELISRLGHYNYQTRLNSLTGIKELVTNYPQVLEGPMLRTIITRVLELLIDIEHKIRVTAIGLLNDLFSRIPHQFLVPFYDLLNVHVGCAMTHRELSIQQDSLKFIDVMVQHAPKAVEKNFLTLVENFIRILTSFKYGHHSESNFQNKSKQDVEKSRVEMLKKFHLLLNIVHSKSKDASEYSDEMFVQVPSKRGRFDLKSLNSSYKKTPDLSKLFKVTRTHSSPSIMSSGCADEYEHQVSAIVSLLMNIWGECAPDSSDNFASECLITENTAQLLLIILQILLLLYEKAASLEDRQKEHWFLSTFGANFMKSIMHRFPYSPNITSKKEGQNSEEEFSRGRPTAYKAQNLIVCYLYHRFKVRYSGDDLESKVDKYVLDALRTKNPSEHKILVKVIQVMMKTSPPAKLEEITSLLVKVHEATSIPEYRRRLFAILTTAAVSDENGHGLCRTNHFQKWFKSLPEKLLEPRVPLYVVETILRLVSRDAGKEILKSLEGNAVRIASQLPNVRVDDKEEFDGQKLIGNILYRCENDVLREILNGGVLAGNSYPEKVRNYLSEIISFKINKGKTTNDTTV